MKNFLAYGNKIVYITMALVVSALIIDTSLIRIVPFYHTYSDIAKRTFIFLIIFIIFIAGEAVIMPYSFKSILSTGDKRELAIIRRALLFSQSILSILLSIIIIHVYYISKVYTDLLIISASISYGLSSIIFGILTCNFWLWYISKKNLVILSYAICCLALTFNFITSIVFVDILLNERQKELFPQLGLSDKFIATDLLTRTIQYSYVISLIVSFIAAWVASVVLLYHYSERKGRIRSWILMSLPLVVFLSQFIGSFFDLFSSLVGEDPVFFSNILTIVYTISRPAGGILFGLAFWIISRYVAPNSIVRGYLIRSAYGFILLFVSNQAIVLINTSYPPFGIITISFLPIASFLVLTGIYSTALSVSSDVILRRSIKRSLEKEVLFLDSIAVAQMSNQIQNKVLGMAKKISSDIQEETGIENSMTEDDIKSYIQEALKTKISVTSDK